MAHTLDTERGVVLTDDMTLNEHIERGIAAFGIVGTLAFGAWAGQAIAHAEPQGMINLTDIHDIDTLPVCVEEDCSDQVGQVGVWLDRDTGNWYLERGEDYTRMIVDNTVTFDHGTAAADGGAPGPDYLTDDIGWDAGYEG